MRSFLQDIAGSLDFDLSQVGSWKVANEQAIALYGRFYKFAETGGPPFWDTVRDFMKMENPLFAALDQSAPVAMSVDWSAASSSSSSSSSAPPPKKMKKQ